MGCHPAPTPSLGYDVKKTLYDAVSAGCMPWPEAAKLSKALVLRIQKDGAL